MIFTLYAGVAVLSWMLIGFMSSGGLCALIWGSHILDTALGSPPDRTHPAFWLLLILGPPAMLISAAGAFFLFVLPVAFRFPSAARTAPHNSYQLRFLRRYAEHILKYVSTHGEIPKDDIIK